MARSLVLCPCGLRVRHLKRKHLKRTLDRCRARPAVMCPVRCAIFFSIND